MLAVFRGDVRALAPCTDLPETGWVHASSPTDAERAALLERGVPEAFLAHALDVDELARIDHQADGTLVVLRVPDKLGHNGGPLRTTTVGVVILGPRLCVTIAATPTNLVDALVRVPDLEPLRPVRLLLLWVLAAADQFLREARAIDARVDAVEEALSGSLQNREVVELLKHQKSLVHLTTALSSNQIMLERLQRDTKLGIATEDQELLEDALVEFRQAVEMTRVSEEILSNMMDAFASIISNNLNVVMKVLTSLTIVLTFPMLVVSIYGMNVELPFAGSPRALAIVLLFALCLGGFVAIVFRRRHWL